MGSLSMTPHTTIIVKRMAYPRWAYILAGLGCMAAGYALALV